MELGLDHLVINAKTDLDRYETLFRRLGFTLTPRGYHSLGSINHLIVFEDHYLELIGYTNKPRQDLLESHVGIDGLVFKMDEPKQVFNDLKKKGFAVQQPQEFSRPVENGDAAKFTTIRLQAGQFPEGRIYFCHHHTPHLVWQEKYQSHPNGVRGIKGIRLASTSPETSREQYQKLGHPVGFNIEISNLPDVSENRFTAIHFECTSQASLERLASYARDSGLSSIERNNYLQFSIGDGATLEFTV